MSYEEASKIANRDESFMATVYAMNTLLIQKGFYSQEEFRALFAQWVEKERKKEKASDTTSQATFSGVR